MELAEAKVYIVYFYLLEFNFCWFVEWSEVKSSRIIR